MHVTSEFSLLRASSTEYIRDYKNTSVLTKEEDEQKAETGVMVKTKGGFTFKSVLNILCIHAIINPCPPSSLQLIEAGTKYKNSYNNRVEI